MVAYNLLLSIFPFALVALFVAGRLLRSEELQVSLLEDLKRVFPTAAESTLSEGVRRLQQTSTTVGLAAIAAAIWFGASFWGALDTAFCRIYHCECRSWVQQKLFALGMLVVVLLFVAATVAVPTVQALLASGARDLPFGLSEVRGSSTRSRSALGVRRAVRDPVRDLPARAEGVDAVARRSGPARSARRSRSRSSTSASRCTWTTSPRCGSGRPRCSC